MIECLPSNPRLVRARPLTFAYTRPLSPQDVSGITGRLQADAAKPVKASGAKRLLDVFKGWFATGR